MHGTRRIWLANALSLFFILSLTACDDETTCGDGTVLVGDECVPEDEVGCGDGTVLVDGECIPEDEVVCGEGTVLVGGECVPEGEVVCGDGTVLVDGECVPEDEVVCGDGTVLVDGECRPESEVVCGDGTVLVDGECQPEITACGEGTVLDEGECVPWIEVIEADQMESAEDNNPFTGGTAGEIELPAEGAEPLILGGTIDTPTDPFGTGTFFDPDLDTWAFTATAGTRIAVEGWSDGLFNVAFVIEGIEAGVNDDYICYGMSVSNVEAQREFVIPVDGIYLLSVSDAANFDMRITDFTVGGPDLQYFLAVSVVTNPDPSELTLGSTVTGDITDVDQYEVSATAGTVMEIAVDEWGGHYVGVITVIAAGGGVLESWYLGEPVKRYFIMPEEGATITVDYYQESNLVADDPGYSLAVSEATNITDVDPGETQSFDLVDALGVQFIRIDAAAGTVIDAELTATGDNLQANFFLLDENLAPVAGGEPDCFDGGYLSVCRYWNDTMTAVPFSPLSYFTLEGGVYYLEVSDAVSADGAGDHNFSVAVDTTTITINDLGTIDGATSPMEVLDVGPIDDAAQVHYYLVEAATPSLLSASAVPSGAGVDLVIEVFDTELELLETSDVTGSGENEDWSGPVSGAIILGVSATSASADDNFDLILNAAPFAAEVEPNGDLASAQTVVVDGAGSTLIGGTIVDVDDLDWYEVTIPAGGGTLTAEASPGTASGDTYLWLYAADGTTVIAENEDTDASGGNFFSTVTADLTGETTYYVVVGCTLWAGYCVANTDYILNIDLTL